MKLKQILIFICLSFSCIKSFSQSKISHSRAIGINAQIYPAGIISSLSVIQKINNHNELNLRLGGNFTNRRNYSAYNDFEKGSGLGSTLGYRRNIELFNGFLVAGFNVDLWNMWIHWENNRGTINQTTGRTYTLVLQPWLEVGYMFPVKKLPLKAGLTTGFGREINIVTRGHGVGQGWMNSIALYCQFNIK